MHRQGSDPIGILFAPDRAAFFILSASGIALATRGAWLRIGRAATAVPFVAVLVIAQGRPFVAYALHDWVAQKRVSLMGHDLREALPVNAAVLSFLHSGTLAYDHRA